MIRTEIETADVDSDEIIRENQFHNDFDELINTLDENAPIWYIGMRGLALQTISKPSCIGIIIGFSRSIEQEISKAKLCHLRA